MQRQCDRRSHTKVKCFGSKNHWLNTVSGLVIAGAWLLSEHALHAENKPSSVADEIRDEATRPNDSGVGRPLPLATHWNAGVGFVTPDYFGVGFPPIVQLGY